MLHKEDEKKNNKEKKKVELIKKKQYKQIEFKEQNDRPTNKK